MFEFRDFVNHHEKVACSDQARIEELTPRLSTVQLNDLTDQCASGVETAEIAFGMTPKTNLFGSTFFTLTGFHGAHVTLGVVWLLSLFFLSFKRGMVTPERNLDVDLAALYWHFVDIVWIIIFTVVYLFGVFEGF